MLEQSMSHNSMAFSEKGVEALRVEDQLKKYDHKIKKSNDKYLKIIHEKKELLHHNSDKASKKLLIK
jgi:hypothetical protein